MPEVGIVMTLRDRISSTMKSIAASGKALSSDFEDLYERVEATENRQTALAKALSKTKTSIAQQTDTVKAAQKAWNTLRREKDATAESIADAERAYREESEKLEQLKNNLNEYTEASKDARAETKELYAEWRKVRQDMDASGGSGGGSSPSGGSGDGLLAQLGKAGLYKMVGDVASQWADTLAGSALGDAGGSLFSSTLSGAGAGAAIGSIIPGIGTAVGAVVGAGAGLLTGGAQIFEAKDDAFKSYVQDAAENAASDQETAVSSGSTIAGSREQTRMAFAQRFGSDEAAGDYLRQVEEMAARTNYSYDEITGYAKLLLNSYSADETFGVLQRLSDATAGLGLSSSDVNVMISGLSRMRTTGKATQEYLNYFSERGVDVYAALGQSLGVDKSQVAGLVTDGAVDGAQAAEAILEYINQEFGGLSEKLMGTYDAMVDNLADAEANLQARAGEGYNEERKKGIQAQQTWLDQSGDSLGDAYGMIGQWKASLENLAEQYEREALDAVMTGAVSDLWSDSSQRQRLEELAAEYQQALADYEAGSEEAGAAMGKLLAEAQVMAQNEYNASDGAQLALQAQLELADQIREDTTSDSAFWDAGYQKGQEYSKGLVNGMKSDILEGFATANAASRDYLNGEYDGPAPKYAYGLQRVPYDNFPALLHEGERVLTASEARAMSAGSGGVTIQVGQLSVREEADVDRVAEALYERLLLANMAG